jgi:tRNA modification GTPase
MALQFDHLQTDTIAAIATAMSEAGIGIIRISGPDAAAIGSKLYRTPKKNKTDIALWNPGTIRFGYIVETDEDGQETLIDEVMLSWMKSPHSYTTEDTVEINTHGGMFLMNRILALVLGAGARMAEPGEFTKRAFLGGRIDLARAEAVMDLISSRNEFARKTSAAQLAGSVSTKVKELREKILYEIAFIESALDDPENYTLEGYTDRLMDTCRYLEKEMRTLLSHADEGRILREGIRTAIV